MVADEVQMCRIVQDGERHDRKELIVTVDQELVLTPLARDRVRLGSVARPESNAPRAEKRLLQHRPTTPPQTYVLSRQRAAGSLMGVHRVAGARLRARARNVRRSARRRLNAGGAPCSWRVPARCTASARKGRSPARPGGGAGREGTIVGTFGLPLQIAGVDPGCERGSRAARRPARRRPAAGLH